MEDCEGYIHKKMRSYGGKGQLTIVTNDTLKNYFGTAIHKN